MTIIGNVDEISRRRVVGWAYDTSAPNAGLPIAIRIDGQEFGRCTADLSRDRLKEHLGGDATGLYGFEYAFDPPLSVFKEYTVRASVVGAEKPLPNGVKLLPSPPPASGHLLPIVVTSTGRSGTTLLMSEFAASPDIVVAGAYPFEIKQIGYYSAVFRTLTAPADRTNSTDPETMFSPQNRHHIGHNPYNSLELHSAAGLRRAFEAFYEKTAPQKFSALFQQLIDEYYDAVRSDQGKPLARFLAEKGELDEAARLGARQFLGRVRELVVVRDPRDLLCSAMRFWKLEPPDALRMLNTTLPRLEEIHREAAADSLFVRYEDLITTPAATRRQIYRFLGIDPETAPLPEADPKLFARHGTSARPADSVQRWERDLDSELIAACNSSFASYMERFGYEPAGGGKRSVAEFATAFEHPSGLRVVAGAERAVGLLTASEDDRRDLALEIVFGSNGNSARYLGQGWGRAESGFNWTGGLESRLEFPRPQMAGDYRLRLFVRAFLWQEQVPHQRITVVANGAVLGSAAIAEEIAIIECDIPWVALARHSNATLVLLLPDAARPSEVRGSQDDRLLAFRFQRLELLLVAALPHEMEGQGLVEAEAGGERRALMARFQNIGENCEFGFVQRRCGVDPLELLRFSSSPIPRLMAALKSEFAGIGDPGMLRVELSANGREFMVHEKKYGFVHHAWVLAGEMTPEEIHRREAARLPSLVRNLIEDLKRAAKIVVYHGMERLAQADVLSLLEVLRGYGPNTMLWVELADSEHAPGTVEWAAPYLLKAYIDRFAPIDDPNDMSLDIWAEICREAYRLWRDAQPGGSDTQAEAGPAGGDAGSGLRIIAEGADAPRLFAAAAGPQWETPVLDIRFGEHGNSDDYAEDGWSGGESGYTWNARRESRLKFPRPARPGPHRLRMLIRAFVWREQLPSQRLVFQVNGVGYGSVTVAEEPAVIECDLPWSVLDHSEEVKLVFSFPDAAKPSELKGGSDDRLLAFRFERIALTRPEDTETGSPETGGAAPASDPTEFREAVARTPQAGSGGQPVSAPAPVPAHRMLEPDVPLGELMMRFESLGENCEFGLVQRSCRAEPLGLFRFASAPLPKLMAGLEAGFEGLGDADNLEVQLSSNGREYMVYDKRFQLLYHAWVLAQEMSASEVHQRETRRLPRLIAKLIEDLRQAEKILIFHGMDPLAEEEARRLLALLRRYGPNTLLWIEVADAEHPPGTVAWLGEGLLKAYIDRFAPGEDAHDLSIDCWIAICREADRLWRVGAEAGRAHSIPASAAAQ